MSIFTIKPRCIFFECWEICYVYAFIKILKMHFSELNSSLFIISPGVNFLSRKDSKNNLYFSSPSFFKPILISHNKRNISIYYSESMIYWGHSGDIFQGKKFIIFVYCFYIKTYLQNRVIIIAEDRT